MVKIEVLRVHGAIAIKNRNTNNEIAVRGSPESNRVVVRENRFLMRPKTKVETSV